MRIIFLCSSLEFGRDGVGDYTRRLAGELISNNHQVAIIALHDQYLQLELEERSQIDGILEIKTLRLSCQLSWKERILKASEFVKKNNPDWISLQYVPFGFHHKGLPIRLAKYLKTINGNRKLHIMFHELWVGIARGASIKFVIWGWLQKRLFHSLLITLNPTIIHTQTLLYKTCLKRLNVEAKLLPLFSNIPVSRFINTSAAYCKAAELHKKSISFVVFGTIHPNAPINKFANESASFAKRHNIQISLTLIGRCGFEQNHWIDVWQSVGLTVDQIGEQPAEIISEILAKATVGIGTTASVLIGKSGSVAAMREHGLPILCVADSWQAKGGNIQEIIPGITQYFEGSLEAYLTNLHPTAPSNGLTEVANQFIESLGANY